MDNTLNAPKRINSFIPAKRTLMGPGPSDVPERILQAMARPTLGHLDPDFVGMMDEIKTMLQYAFQTENQMTMAVSAPGSAGMEMCFVNLVEPGDKVIVCQNGVFGGRMKENVIRARGECVLIEDDWGKPVDIKKVEQALEMNPDTKVLAFVHAETSTGARSDARELVKLAKNYDCLTIVDTVTSLGGIELRVDDWEIDAVYSGSQKCLSCTPGLSPVSFSDRALHVIRNRKVPVQSWFLDLNLVMGYWGSGAKRAYHHTAPVNTLYGLHEALVMLQEEGLEEAWDRHYRNHLILKEGLSKIGLKYFVSETHGLPQLNAVSIPEGVDDAGIRNTLLREYGIEIGGGLGPMAGKIWRIGLMGCSSNKANIDKLVKALGELI